MENGGQYNNARYKPDYYKGAHSMQQMKEQDNALVMNKKIMSILAEKYAAIQERNEALSTKREALEARDEALQQRDKAITERDNALLERDNALAALQHRTNGLNFSPLAVGKRGSRAEMSETISAGEADRKTSKRKKTGESKGMKVGEDLNRRVASPGKKSRTDWESTDVGLNLVTYDVTTMPVPVCTCTGTAHQCYKWGNGGWQSSCCTTTLSQYPLPQMPNKRHSRVGGRKMSGSVFTRLLSRLAAEGHDLACRVDLKDYWARHGTNRYITIK